MTNTSFASVRLVASGLIAFAALVTGGPAAAQFDALQNVRSSATESYSGIGQTSEDQRFGPPGSTSSTATWTRADGLGSATVSSGMTVGPGLIRANLSLSYQGLVDTSATANGGLTDPLRFTAQGQDMSGQPLRVIYSVIVDKRQTAENSSEHGLFGPGSYDMRGIGDFGESGSGRQLEVIDNGTYTRTTYEATVYSDRTYNLSWHLLFATVYSYNLFPPVQMAGHGSASFDLAFYWGGIQSVTDSSGNPLSYAVTAGSGSDYRNSFAPAVPEPSSMALMVAGGLLLVVVQRRRGSRNQGSIAAQRQS